MNELKLEFLKRILIDAIENEQVYKNFFIEKDFPRKDVMEQVLSVPIKKSFYDGFERSLREHTMIGYKRLNNVHQLLDEIRINKIEGDLIETGVWRGGCCIFMSWYLKLYGIKKKIFVADSFEGLPKPDVEKYPQDYNDNHHLVEHLKVSLEEVKDNFIQYDALNENVVFLKGWFKDTLKDNSEIKKLSLIRLDGDMYGSTMDALFNLYDKGTKGGFLIIDDYCHENCVLAVTDFRNQKNITKEINVVDQCGVYWQI